MANMTTNPFSGIVFNDPNGGLQRLPLEKVKVDALVVDVSARVDIIQQFYNPSRHSTPRAKYVFPVPANAAVCAFEMRTMDGVVVIGRAKEKARAQQEHEQAIQEGKQSALLDWATGDVLTISVGPIPGEEIVITTITYVMNLLDNGADAHVRLFIPVAVGQRYGEIPREMVGANAPSSQTRLRFTISVQMQGSIRKISSPSHQDRIVVEPYKTHFGRPSSHRNIVRFRSRDYLTQDFVLLIQAVGLDRPRCFVEYDNKGGKTVAMQLTLMPKFDLPPVPKQEFIFLIDRSSSMDGPRIDTAKRTLSMLLRALPSRGTTFNVFSFGSKCDEYWAKSEPYAQNSLDNMTGHIDSMKANYGGTNIRGALEKTLAARDISKPTTLFVLTDGEAYDVDATKTLVKGFVSCASSTAPLRVFTLGIGESVSTAMCQGIADAGNGECLQATTGDEILGKCATLVRAGRSFLLKNISVDWGVSVQPPPTDDADPPVPLDGNVLLRQAPSQIQSIFWGMRRIVFAITRAEGFVIPRAVTLRAQRDGTGQQLSFSIPVEQVKFEQENIHVPLVHTLAIKKMIEELEHPLLPSTTEGMRKAEIVRLAEAYQLASRYTSFVAVKEGIDDSLDMQSSNTLQAHRHRRLAQRASVGIGGQTSYAQLALDYITSFGSAFVQTWVVPDHLQERIRSRVPHGALDSDDEDNDDRGQDDQDDHDTDETFSSMSSLISSLSSSTERSSRPPSPSPDTRSPSPSFDIRPNHTTTSDTATTSDPRIFQLIDLQSSDGFFEPSPLLENIVGQDAIAQGRMRQLDERLWATALAVAYLQKHQSLHPELLDAMIQKALEYASFLPVEMRAVGFETLVEEARILVG